MNAAVTIILAITASALEPAPAHPDSGPARPHPREFRPGVFVERLAEAVDATPEQVARLEAIAAETRTARESARTGRRESFREHRDELRGLREQLRDARRAGDRQGMEATLDQIQALLGEPPRDAVRGARNRVKEVLTDQQREKAAGFMREHRRGAPGLRFHPGGGGERPHVQRIHGWARSGAGDAGKRGIPHSAFRNPHSDGGPNIYDLVRRINEVTRPTGDQTAQLNAIAREHVHAVKDAEAQRIIAHEERGEELRELHEQLRGAEDAADQAVVERIRAQLREILGPPPRGLFRAARERIESVLTEDQRSQLPRIFPKD